MIRSWVEVSDAACASALNAQRVAGPLGLTQLVLAHLAGGRLRELVDERDLPRSLERREEPAHVLDQLRLVDARARAADHERLGTLTPALVGRADHRHLEDAGMAGDRVLDLDRRDVLAAADDHVLRPVAEL